MPGGSSSSAGYLEDYNQKVQGRHLLRVSVDGIGLAKVSLSGHVDMNVQNSVPFPIMSASGGYPPPDSGGPAQAEAFAFVSGSAQPDYREMGISCPDIETSWYKGSYDSQHGTDRYQHVRQPSSNSVDSAVSLLNDPATGQHFVAGHSYNSNASGFNQPIYNWTVSGDGKPDATTLANLNPKTSSNPPYGLASVPVNLDFGATWDTTTTKASQIGLNVNDSDGATDGDTYSVTWHAPVEKYAVLSVQKGVTRLIGQLQDIQLQASIPANATIPGQEGQIDWGYAKQQMGTPVAVAGAGVGGLLLIPEVAAGPDGWAVILLQALCSAASYQLGTSTPDNPGTVPIQGNADYHEYLADLQHEVTKQTDPSHANDLIRFKPEWLAPQAYAAEQDPASWDADP